MTLSITPRFALLAAALLLAACQTASLGGGSKFIVEKYDPSRAFNGTTLLTDTTDRFFPRIVEIDMRGNEVWSYDITNGAGRNFAGPDILRHSIMDVEQLANGNILFNLKKHGVFEIDRSGGIVWQYLDPEVSHDADRLANGNTIYVRGWVEKGEDHVREVTPQGDVVWSWNAIPQFDRPEFQPIPGALNGWPGSGGWIHVNGVTRLGDGSTAISLRNFQMMAYVDQKGNVIKTLKQPSVLDYPPPRGKSGPHDPQILANGNVLTSLTAHNRVEETSDGKRVWIWEHPAPGLVGIRDANRLPNGNTLVIAGDHMMEITWQGKTVWLMRSAVFERPLDSRPHPQQFFKAQRIGGAGGPPRGLTE